MHLSISEPLPLPAEEVFLLLRDDMPALVPFLHDIDRIEVLERRDEAGAVHIVNLWQGSTKAVPAPARPFLSADLLSWKDHATWTPTDRRAHWRLEPRLGGGYFSCTGTTQVLVAGDLARLQLEVDLDVYPERVPGVPRMLAGRLRGTVEQTIAGQIRPNLENLAGSIRAWARARPGSGGRPR